MRWINKRNKNNRKRAHRIVNRFLRNAWDNYSKSYVNCDFDTFKKTKNLNLYCIMNKKVTAVIACASWT